MSGRAIPLSIVLSIASAGFASAQSGASAGLNETQELGRILTSQTCVVCHFPLQRGAHTYGPRLSKDSMGGDEGLLREMIGTGTQRMPGFKYMFDDKQIGAVVQFIKTLPPGPDTQKKD